MKVPKKQTTATIITHRNKTSDILGFSWEITTAAAIIHSRNHLTKKNDCYNSLKNHYKYFIGAGIDRFKVKNREEVES